MYVPTTSPTFNPPLAESAKIVSMLRSNLGRRDSPENIQFIRCCSDCRHPCDRPRKSGGRFLGFNGRVLWTQLRRCEWNHIDLASELFGCSQLWRHDVGKPALG